MSQTLVDGGKLFRRLAHSGVPATSEGRGKASGAYLQRSWISPDQRKRLRRHWEPRHHPVPAPSTSLALRLLYKRLFKTLKNQWREVLQARKPTGAAMIGAIQQERRVQMSVRRGAVLKTLCKGQGQCKVRSPKVICWAG